MSDILNAAADELVEKINAATGKKHVIALIVVETGQAVTPEYVTNSDRDGFEQLVCSVASMIAANRIDMAIAMAEAATGTKQ